MSNSIEKKNASVFPEHGPVNEYGREVLLSVNHVDITFGKGDTAVRAVQDASFDIYKGETFSLVGESGSGKTTVGRAVIRVNPLAAGEISFKGVPITGKISSALDREVIRRIQMVFQDPAASLNERATVDYIISEGLSNFHLYQNEAERVEKVENIIREVGLLPEHLTRYPHEFSGGQRQRIGLARCMVMEPELVVADEPISALDVSVRAQVLNLMKKFQRENGTTYLFIAHDLSIVRFISDRIGVIYKGRIVEVADAEELFAFPLHPYTRSLLSAIPIPDPKLEKNKVLYTYDASIHDYETDKPEFVNIGHDHWVYGNAEELEEYRRIRETGVPMKTIQILDPNVKEQVLSPEADGETLQKGRTEKAAASNQKTTTDSYQKDAAGSAKAGGTGSSEIALPPAGDTGGFWYLLLSFLLPVIGLIAAVVFRKNNYLRNYKACRKGAVAGLVCLLILILLTAFFFILALI